MNDRRLRDSERRSLVWGSVEDEARYLADRVRRGELSLARVELAAYCAHPAAVRALELQPRSDQQAPWRLDQLVRWREQTVLVRAALAAAHVALAHHAVPEFAAQVHQGLRDAILAWCAAPDAERQRDVAAQLARLEALPRDQRLEALRQAALGVVPSGDAGVDERASDSVGASLFSAATRFKLAVSFAQATLQRQALEVDLHEAMQRELADWALASGEP